MGVRASYVMSPLPAPELAHRLRHDLAERVSAPPQNKAHVLTISRTGHSLLWVQDSDYLFCFSQRLARASHGTRLIGVGICETTMRSAAICWEEGKEIWSIIHNLSSGGKHLHATGALPRCFDSIKHRIFTQYDAEVELSQAAKSQTQPDNLAEIAKRADACLTSLDPDLYPYDLIFGVPVEVAASIEGFAYNTYEEEDIDAIWTAIPREKPPSFLAQLLGLYRDD